MHIDIRKLGGRAVLAGAFHGKKVLNALLATAAEEPSGPEPMFLDFRDVDVATASFLRESVLAFRDHIRSRRSALYPVIANANENVRDELTELVKSRGDILIVCTLTKGDHVEAVTLFGDLHPKQKVTFELVRERGETDAAELMRKYGKREGITQTTAWNNRLSALANLGLIVEISQGRNRRYRPLFVGG